MAPLLRTLALFRPDFRVVFRHRGFTSELGMCYVSNMNRSYVGIITAQGLQALYSENDHLLRFVVRRIYRKRPYDGICCWAVIPEEAAELIERQTEQGESQLAFQALQEYSIHGGSILPAVDDS